MTKSDSIRLKGKAAVMGFKVITCESPVRSSEVVVPPEAPKILEEWLWYVHRYQGGIYVREQGGNARLADLPSHRWAFHVARWLEEGAIPCRVLEDQERRHNAKAER